jgi:hypothetical protein
LGQYTCTQNNKIRKNVLHIFKFRLFIEKKKKKKKRSLGFGLVTGIPASSPPPALGCIQDYPGTLWLEYTTLWATAVDLLDALTGGTQALMPLFKSRKPP